ncbi:MAG: protein kinase [Deltaproteobacteria bacterium]|nr:protein kinase [Deltaproteobacteria bacterium]
MSACPACGAENQSDNAFCGACGSAIDTSRARTVTEQHQRPSVDSPSSISEVVGDPLVGQVIADRYRILELIGRGGMGVVYKVEHVGMGKLMAMKLLHGELSRDREIVKRFKREAQAASLLKHINTVSIFDFGRADGLMYLVMEYIDGVDLGRMIRTMGPLPQARVAGLIAQSCGSIAEAHECGIVHRDLKPENMLVSQTRDKHDFVKVLDFGLAKLRESEHQLEITSAGSLIGTPYYMAPEQIRGETVDGRTDIYALGAMMYKTLSGSPPFSASTPVGVLTRHLTEQVVPLAERFPELGISEEVDRIVLKAMAKKPSDRFQRVDEIRDDLVAYLDGEGVEFGSADGWRLAGTSSHPGKSPVALPVPEAIAVGRKGDRVIKVATREEYDRYEKRLRRGRYAGWFVLLAMLGVASTAAALAWRKKDKILRSETEIEPNDIPDQANSLWPDQAVRAYLGKRHSPTESDRDWYRFDVPGGPGVLRAEVTPVPNMDVVLELIPQGESQPIFKADEDGVGGGEAIAGLRVTARTYFLLVRELWVDGHPPTENVSDAYDIHFELQTPSPAIESEPNDNLEQAGHVRPGESVEGYVGGRRDLDDFCVAGPVETGRTLSVRVTGVEEVDLVLRVVDRARSSSRVVDQGGTGFGESFSGIEISEGAELPCFEVGVRQGPGSRGNPWKPYSLSVSSP